MGDQRLNDRSAKVTRLILAIISLFPTLIITADATGNTHCSATLDSAKLNLTIAQCDASLELPTTPDRAIKHLEISTSTFGHITATTFLVLPALESLVLRSTEVLSCEANSFNNLLHVASLKLDGNNVANCTMTFGDKTSLKSVEIKQEGLTAGVANTFSPTLKHLKIFDSSIVNGVLIIDRNYTQLSELSLGNCTLRELYIKVDLTSLKKLNLSGNSLQRDKFLHNRLDELEELDLSNNFNKYLAQFNYSLLPKLKTLSLRGNLLRRIDSDTFLRNIELKSLDLADNNFLKIGLLYTVNNDVPPYLMIVSGNPLDCAFRQRFGTALKLQHVPSWCLTVWWKILFVLLGLLLSAILIIITISWRRRVTHNRKVMLIVNQRKQFTINEVNKMFNSKSNHSLNREDISFELIKKNSNEVEPITPDNDSENIYHIPKSRKISEDDNIYDFPKGAAADGDENIYDIPKGNNVAEVEIEMNCRL